MTDELTHRATVEVLKDKQREVDRLQAENERLRGAVSKLSTITTRLGAQVSDIMRFAERLPAGKVTAYHRLTTEQAIAIGHACINANYDAQITAAEAVEE